MLFTSVNHFEKYHYAIELFISGNVEDSYILKLFLLHLLLSLFELIGRPSDLDKDRLDALIRDDPHESTRKLAGMSVAFFERI